MRPDDHAKLVHFQELVHLIRAVIHDVVLLCWVSYSVGMHADHIFRGRGVRPEKVHGHLLHLFVDASKVDFEGSVNLLDVFQLGNSGTKAPMHAEDSVVCRLVLDDGTQRKPFKEIVHLLENTVWVFDIFRKALGALQAETKVLVHLAVLVIPSQKEDLLRILELKCKQQAQDFEALGPAINIIAQEEVIKTRDVTRLARSLPNVEESHEIVVITMNVSENLDRRLKVLF